MPGFSPLFTKAQARHLLVAAVLQFTLAGSLLADYLVSPSRSGFQAVNSSGGESFASSKAYRVINWAIQRAGANGGGVVHLAEGEYDIGDFDPITSDGVSWISARPDVRIDNNSTESLPPYQARGTSVTKLTIAASASGEPKAGLIAYINFPTPVDLSRYRAIALWLSPNKSLMAANSSRLQFTFSKQANAVAPFRSVKVWHSDGGKPGWRGHRLPSLTSDGFQLDNPLLPPLTGVRSIGIEIIADPQGQSPIGNTDTVIYLDDLTGHYGQLDMTQDKVVLEGEGPYHTVLKLADYANLPAIYLTARGAGIRQLQIHGNTDNQTLIDYCGGIDSPWELDSMNTSIHHVFIQQTQGSSITMRGSNVRIYENLLTFSENPMIGVVNGNNVDINSNTLKYCTNDSFIYLKYSNSYSNSVTSSTFFPVTKELRLSGSPDVPASYATSRFHEIVNRGVHAYFDTYGHIIKNNKFYNMRSADQQQQAVLLSHGARNILIEGNYFYNSNVEFRKWGWSPGNSRLKDNYFSNGSFTIYGGRDFQVEGNVFDGDSSMRLLDAVARVTGTGNYLGTNATFYDASSGSSVGLTSSNPGIVEPRAGASWEWGSVINGGFEDGSGQYPDGWVQIGDPLYSTHIWTTNPLLAVHGAKAAQTIVQGFVGGPGFQHQAGWTTASYIRVFPGEVLTAQALVKLQRYMPVVTGGTSIQGLRFRIDYFSEDGSVCATPGQDVAVLTDNRAWVRLKSDIVVPRYCTRAILGIYLANANGRFTIDEVKLYRKYQARDISMDVSLDNADFENFSGSPDDLVADSFQGWADRSSASSAGVMAVSNSTDGSIAMQIQRRSADGNAWISQQLYPLEPDTDYHLEFWAKTDAVSPAGWGRIQIVDVYPPKVWLHNDLSIWDRAGTYVDDLTVAENDWTRKAINFRTPSASVFSGNVELRFFSGGTSSLYIDKVRLYQGFGYATPPRPGTSPVYPAAVAPILQ